MDSGLGDKLRDILNDPAAMEKIMQIVSGLSNQQSTPAFNQNAEYTPPPPPPPAGNPSLLSGLSGFGGKSGLDSLAALAPALGGGDKRLALLSTLRPLLREEKRQKLDNLKTALTIAGIIGNFRKKT
ncbi:MAG: hypothetical protein GX148_04410 [Clostridiales bacterium]|nr:hypothetical protein [Clostridiales bacterium]